MVLAFREPSGKGGLTGWSYATAGGLRDDPDQGAYFEQMRRAEAGSTPGPAAAQRAVERVVHMRY